MKKLEIDALPDEGVSHDVRIRKRVALRKGEIPHVMQFARAAFRPGQVARAHAHADMWEVFLCNAGRGRITVDGQPQRLKPGCFVVVEPGEVHEVENDGDTDLVLDVLGIADG
jgi:quercetin dioxygenase-like cupin family protein